MLSLRPLINVASALLVDEDGRILLAQRPEGKGYAGWWELPGGKLEPGELPAPALSRELEEELGLIVDPLDWAPVTFVAHSYPDLPMQALVLIHATNKWQGQPESREGQAFHWVGVNDLKTYRLLPTMKLALDRIEDYIRGDRCKKTRPSFAGRPF